MNQERAGGNGSSGDGGFPWSTVAGVAAAGVLLLALFVARQGSPVALTAAVVIAGILSVVAIAGVIRSRPRLGGGASRPGSPFPPFGSEPQRRPSSRPPVPRTLVPPPTPARQERPESPRRPAAEPSRPTPARPPEPAAAARIPSQPQPPVPPLPEHVTVVAAEIARRAISDLDAPAAAILVERGSTLTAAGSAGDWASARRGLPDVAVPGLYDSHAHENAPPEFPLDPGSDALQQLLVLHDRAIAVERWQELSDVPSTLLPLAGLAASGVGVAVPLIHQRQFAALWVLAQRPQGRPYTDADLEALQRLAQDASRTLGETLAREGR